VAYFAIAADLLSVVAQGAVHGACARRHFSSHALRAVHGSQLASAITNRTCGASSIGGAVRRPVVAQRAVGAVRCAIIRVPPRFARRAVRSRHEEVRSRAHGANLARSHPRPRRDVAHGTLGALGHLVEHGERAGGAVGATDVAAQRVLAGRARFARPPLKGHLARRAIVARHGPVCLCILSRLAIRA
jgi:hypothetical protein